MGCVRYTDRSPPCNHACFTNPANKKINSLYNKCKRHTCTKDNISASGTWDMADYDRKFICIVGPGFSDYRFGVSYWSSKSIWRPFENPLKDKKGSQLPWITKMVETNTKWIINLQNYHPLDKTKKLSQKKAKFRTLAKYVPNSVKLNKIRKKIPGVGFKAGGKKPIIRLMFTGHSDTFNYSVPNCRFVRQREKILNYYYGDICQVMKWLFCLNSSYSGVTH